MGSKLLYVSGLPRSRTAWATALLNTIPGVLACHESEPSGHYHTLVHSCPSLILRYDELRECDPDAKWLLLEREPDESFSALRKVCPDMTAGRFSLAVDAFQRAAKEVTVIPWDADFDQWNDAVKTLTRLTIDRDKFNAMAALRITHDVTPFTEPPIERELPTPPEGHSIRLVRPSDIPLAERWWTERHEHFNPAILPPLGVAVEKGGQVIALMWLRESFNCPVADLCYPITPPGQSLAVSTTAIRFASECLMALAGSIVTPPAHYSIFHATVSPALARVMKTWGWSGNTSKTVVTHIHG